jgi:hypothetical protein
MEYVVESILSLPLWVPLPKSTMVSTVMRHIRACHRSYMSLDRMSIGLNLFLFPVSSSNVQSTWCKCLCIRAAAVARLHHGRVGATARARLLVVKVEHVDQASLPVDVTAKRGRYRQDPKAHFDKALSE